MKFSIITALAAAALVQVGATPIRVMVIDVTQPGQAGASPASISNMRFGHAAGPNNANLPKILMPIHMPAVADKEVKHAKHKSGCRGARFRAKAVEFSNNIRKMLGLPLIEEHHSAVHNAVVAPHKEEAGRVRILPFVGTPNTFVESKEGE
ncbi:hypothetical protein H0H93_012955, partial [Arthromyces matolae]